MHLLIINGAYLRSVSGSSLMILFLFRLIEFNQSLSSIVMIIIRILANPLFCKESFVYYIRKTNNTVITAIEIIKFKIRLNLNVNHGISVSLHFAIFVWIVPSATKTIKSHHLREIKLSLSFVRSPFFSHCNIHFISITSVILVSHFS